MDDEIWYWAVEDGSETGIVDAEDWILSVAASKDGKWIVAGTREGDVIVWDAKSREKVIEFAAHPHGTGWVTTLDLSPDATKIATGSEDNSACVWLLSTGERLHCFEIHCQVLRVEFAPDGCLLAVATGGYYTASNDFIRIYDSRDGHLVVEFKICAKSFAWASDSTKLFALSGIGNIHHFDVTSQKARSIWPIHSSDSPHHMCLAPNGTFIVASAGSSTSFWDTVTHQEIGSVIHHPGDVYSMAISANYDLVIGGKGSVLLWNLCNILSPPYIDDELVSGS